MRLCYQ